VEGNAMPAFIVLVFGIIGVWIMILAVLGFTPIEPSPAKRYRLIVLYAAILHYVWAVSVTLDARASEATSLAGLAWLLSPRLLAPTLFVVASLSLIYAFFRQPECTSRSSRFRSKRCSCFLHGAR